jgi:hypothetical protein
VQPTAATSAMKEGANRASIDTVSSKSGRIRFNTHNPVVLAVGMPGLERLESNRYDSWYQSSLKRQKACPTLADKFRLLVGESLIFDKLTRNSDKFGLLVFGSMKIYSTESALVSIPTL